MVDTLMEIAMSRTCDGVEFTPGMLLITNTGEELQTTVSGCGLFSYGYMIYTRDGAEHPCNFYSSQAARIADQCEKLTELKATIDRQVEYLMGGGCPIDAKLLACL
jgi:hypothetical protein